MALRELPSSLRRLALRDARPTPTSLGRYCPRYASAEATAPQEVSEDFQDLESQSSLSTQFTSDEKIKAYDPVKRAHGRKRELPPSRYV
jgi:large subunit ribosomal protein L5